MSSSVNTSIFDGGLKAGILTLSIVVVVIGTAFISLAPFGLP